MLQPNHLALRINIGMIHRRSEHHLGLAARKVVIVSVSLRESGNQ